MKLHANVPVQPAFGGNIISIRVTLDKNALFSSADRYYTKWTDAGWLTAKLCQDKVNYSFIIPASLTVCQMFWARKMKIDAPT